MRAILTPAARRRQIFFELRALYSGRSVHRRLLPALLRARALRAKAVLRLLLPWPSLRPARKSSLLRAYHLKELEKDPKCTWQAQPHLCTARPKAQSHVGCEQWLLESDAGSKQSGRESSPLRRAPAGSFLLPDCPQALPPRSEMRCLQHIAQDATVRCPDS